MKYCPRCHHIFTDETLKFCREDGTLLQFNVSSPTESSETLTLPAARTSDALPTKLLQSETIQSEEATSPIGTPRNLPTSDTAPRAEYFVSSIRRRKHSVALILSVMLLATAGAGLWFFSSRSASTKPIESIAVLPFVNESGNVDNEYLSDGMTETLIGSLSQIPNLNVKARSSVFRYKGKETDAQTIGQELNVQAILNGRVVQRGAQLTLYMELVDAATGNRIWGEQYNRKTSDLVSLQSEIAREVSNKLKAKLSGADERRVAKTYTENPEAYQLYLKGRFHFNRRTRKDIEKAVEYYSQAIVVDSDYALAYAGLADAYPHFVPGMTPRERMPKAREAALKALLLDKNLAEAHTALGRVLAVYDYDFAAAEREHRRAIELNPNYADAHYWYASLLGLLGRQEESFAEYRRALELEPMSLIINTNYGITLVYFRRYDEAIEHLKKTLELDGNFIATHGNLATAYLLKGNYPESVEALAREREINGEREVAALMRESFAKNGWEGFLRYVTEDRRATRSSYAVATFYAALGEKDKAFAELNTSYENREPQITYIKVDPRLDPLRDDPRLQELLRRIGFTP